MSSPSTERRRSSSPKTPQVVVAAGLAGRQGHPAYPVAACTAAGDNTMMVVSAQDLAQHLWPEPGQTLIHPSSAYPLSATPYASHGSPHEGKANALGLDVAAAAWHRHAADQGRAPGVSLAQNEHSVPSAPAVAWRQNKAPENSEVEGYGSEYQRSGPTYAGHDDGVVDLRFAVPQLEESQLRAEDLPPRTQTTSPFSVSTCAPSVDVPVIDDSRAGPRRSLSMPDYPTTVSTGAASAGFTMLSSPRQGWREGGASPIHSGRASASPRLSVHPPSDQAGLAQSNRWSTGSIAPESPQYAISPTYPSAETYQQLAARHLSLHTSPIPQQARLMPPLGHAQAQQQAYLASQPSSFERPHTLFPPPFLPQDPRTPLEIPPPLPSHGFHQPRPGSGDPRAYRPYPGVDLAAPPDLFASLRREPSAPPPEDMNTSDPEMVPHEQDLRFEGDLYTPRWVRGQGNKREGWCGICEPGRWLVLKNSAFWYDKSFAHGIAATGAPFQGPQATRRMDGNPDVWEGYCGGCHDWIALVSSKKKGTTWFRHAYKCQTQSRPRDQSKRRRDRSPSGRPGTPSVKRPKALASRPGLGAEAIEPVTPSESNVPPRSLPDQA